VASQDPSLLVVLVLLQEDVEGRSGLVVLFVVDANLCFGHQVADRVLVLDVAEGNAGSAENLSLEEEVDQIEEHNVRLLCRKTFVRGLLLLPIDNLNFVLHLLCSEVLRD
jgi:hypothetical protein